VSYPGQFDYLAARLSANQVANLAVNDHVEYDLTDVRGTRISMATGAGQADGIFTFRGGMVYEISFAVRAAITPVVNGTFGLILRTNPGNVDILDDAGGLMNVNMTATNGTTNATTMSSGIYKATFAADVVCSLNINIITSGTVTQYTAAATWFYAKAIGFPGAS
jgi:hypothetical protein